MRFALGSMQGAWSAALMAPDMHAQAVPGPGWRGGLRSPAAGFAVYVNNTRANLHNALAASFPATSRLIGQAAFRKVVLACLRETPPSSGDLGDYGAALVERVATAPLEGGQGIDRHIVAEVARYEWQVDQLPRQAREQAWSLMQAAALSPERWLELRLRPATHTCLFESDVPVRTWVTLALDQDEPQDGPVMGAAECLLLVAGDDATPSVLPLDAAQSAWYRALCASHLLQTATQAALDIAPDFALQPLLQRLLHVGALAVPADLTPTEGAA